MDRLARALVTAAARRWPADLADIMRAEWLAELAAIPGRGGKLAFAASLAVSPAVDEPSWSSRVAILGRDAVVAGGVTLVAATATNIARGSAALAPVLLIVAALALGVAGRRIRASVLLLAGAVFAFLLAGNPVPVMPFMGAADIAPAVLTWAAGMLLVRKCARSLRGAIGGGLVTLGLATIAGSVHAAAVLGVPAWSAPAWFPLALLPGGTVSFGPRFSSVGGPAFHASDILLANAAVMAGPLLLCTAFLLAGAIRVERPAEAVQPRHTAGRGWLGSDAGQIAVGVAAAIAALAVAPRLPTGGDPDTTLQRLLDNSTAFGFGFVEHPVGLGLVALLAALLAMRAADARRTIA
ncbi:hypothetical protein KOI35_38490 [Actinoplanes bogorensis]|uniref:Integral membrane protein n=1 Tax=Paractinoplanes bogorensis TaxID=1610840 RepID=A0ABS5Z149_9ACTN|nr:hypothetical protein [Actinoplanes bogorensis]MBU2669418.1 hypothetical protein [Actinoplanes bogorensis]